jgi:hypothetical protein
VPCARPADAMGRDAWAVAERSPGGYPDAVTLSREAEAAAVLKRVEDGSGCSIKDSFAVLDLGPSGFHVLFEATWIQRPAAGAGSAARSTGAACRRRRTSNSGPRVTDSMSSFLRCWRATIFGFYGAGSADGAGFALNRSSGVVGVSNVFAGSADLITVWSDLVVVAARTYPRFDLVGYELGADLQAGLAVGFVDIGQLRVWMR